MFNYQQERVNKKREHGVKVVSPPLCLGGVICCSDGECVGATHDQSDPRSYGDAARAVTDDEISMVAR